MAQSASPLSTGSLWLRLARWLVLALVAASMLAVLASLALAPAYVSRNNEAYPLAEDWPIELQQAALVELGWPAATVAWFEYGRQFALYLGFLTVGLLIVARKGNDWFGLYLGFVFAVLPGLAMVDPLAERLPALAGLSDSVGAVTWQFFFFTLYLFPDGRFVPRWTRWLTLLWVGLYVIAGAYGSQSAMPGWLGQAYVPLVLIAAGSQVYRYRWASNAVQRQQTKWVVAVVASFAVVLPLAFNTPAPSSPGTTLGTTLQWQMARLIVLNLWFTLVPITIAIAILRYRLWDIDVIIRRTLIYSVLTAVLALAYLGSVLVLESVFRALTGQGQNSLVVVLSTLAIAALFGPLRSRVQRAIDRRFFRQKYDAARTLAGFAAGARDETDLERLSAHLVQVVDETMQPAHTSLWLRPAPGQKSGGGVT